MNHLQLQYVKFIRSLTPLFKDVADKDYPECGDPLFNPLLYELLCLDSDSYYDFYGSLFDAIKDETSFKLIEHLKQVESIKLIESYYREATRNLSSISQAAYNFQTQSQGKLLNLTEEVNMLRAEVNSLREMLCKSVTIPPTANKSIKDMEVPAS